MNVLVYSQLKLKNIRNCYLQHKFELGLSVEKRATTATGELWNRTCLAGT